MGNFFWHGPTLYVVQVPKVCLFVLFIPSRNVFSNAVSSLSSSDRNVYVPSKRLYPHSQKYWICKYDICELQASMSVHVKKFSSHSVLSLNNSRSLYTQPSVHNALQSPAKQLHVLDFLWEILLRNFSTVYTALYLVLIWQFLGTL
jgi:hypothetical protein